MAPIPFVPTGIAPVTILTGALFSALAGPKSSPPATGVAPLAWGTEYSGTGSWLNFSRLSTSYKGTDMITNTTALPSSSTLVYFNTATNKYHGCNNRTFGADYNAVLLNPLQYNTMAINGTTTTANTTTACGQWIEIQKRENTAQSIFAQIVGVSDDVEFGSFDLTLSGLVELSPDSGFDIIQVTDDADAPAYDPTAPIDASTVANSKDLVNVVWQLAANPSTVASPPSSSSSSAPASTTTPPQSTTTAQPTTTTTKAAPKPTTTKAPSPSGQTFTGRGTWFTDTFGSCGHAFNTNQLIVALNEGQMDGTAKCGDKLIVGAKGTSATVVVTVVDTCPSQYCSKGALDLSQAAFKKLASLDTGVLDLVWSFA